MQTAQQIPNLAAGFKNNVGFPQGQTINSGGQPNFQQPQVPQMPQMPQMPQVTQNSLGPIGPLGPQINNPNMQMVPQSQMQFPQDAVPGTIPGYITIFGQNFPKKYFYLFLIFVLIILGYFLWKWYFNKKKDNSDSDDEDDNEEEFGYDQQMMHPMNGMNPGNHPMMNQFVQQQMMARRMGGAPGGNFNKNQQMKEMQENQDDTNIEE